ncbi:MAG TPA: MarR family transcriptional regulator [Variovorax sp.]
MQAPPRTLDDLLLFRTSRLLSVAGGMVIRLCEGRFGITRREWRLIATLAGHGALGSSQLAEHAQLDRARTSRAVSSLAEKGLVSREQPAGDRRHVRLRLTTAGKKLHAQLYPLVSAINTELLGALDAAEVALLDDMLQRLHARGEAMVAAADLPKADRRRREPPVSR